MAVGITHDLHESDGEPDVVFCVAADKGVEVQRGLAKFCPTCGDPIDGLRNQWSDA